jgi:hypothetical protein
LNTLRNRMVSAGLAFVVVATASAPAFAQPTPATPPAIPAKPAKPAAGATATPPAAPAAPKPAQAPAKAAAPAPAAGAAAAKPADPKALTKSGDTKLKAGDFAGALADYEAADAAKPTPELAFAIGECHEKLFKLREAVVAYERFLAASPVPAKLKDKVEPTQKRVAEIKGMSGKVHLESGPANATIVVDGKPSADKTPTDVDLPAGKHTIRVEAEGYESAEREVEVQYAARQDLSIDLEKKAPPPPPPAPVVAEAPKAAPPAPPPPPPPPSKVPAYITGGIAIAALGIGTGFGIAALSKSSDFKTNPTTDTADSGENAALVADMCLGVAITFGVTSAVLFLTKDPPKQASAGSRKVAQKPVAPRVSIVPTPYITPQGGGAGALVRF